MSAERPSICFLTSKLGMGGICRSVLRLANEFAQRSISTTVYCTHPGGSLERELHEDVQLLRGKGSTLRSLRDFQRCLRQTHPDVVISTGDKYNLVSLVATTLTRGHIGTLCTVRVDPRQERLRAGKVFHLTNLAASFAYRYVDATVPVSEGVAEALQEDRWANKANIHVIHNPALATNAVSPATTSASKVRGELGISNDTYIVLGVGRLVPQKDFGTLIEAFSRLSVPQDARLLIAGDGPERSALERRCYQLGIEKKVQFLGYVEDPLPLIAAADVFVLTSQWEGFPNVLVEALSLGTSVVSSDCQSGPREILGRDEYGRLVPVGDVDGFAQVIGEVLANPFASESLQRRARDFDVGTIADRYLEAIGAWCLA